MWICFRPFECKYEMKLIFIENDHRESIKRLSKTPEFHRIENVFFSCFCVRGKFILNRVSLLGGVNLENEGVKVVKRGVPVLIPYIIP